MSKAKIHLKGLRAILQGGSYDQTFTWKRGTTVALATPVDLTGCAARMQIRRKVGSDIVLLELTTANGRIALGGAAGTIRLLIDSAITAAIDWTIGVYDLEIVMTDGSVVPKFYGDVEVVREVTR